MPRKKRKFRKGDFIQMKEPISAQLMDGNIYEVKGVNRGYSRPYMYLGHESTPVGECPHIRIETLNQFRYRRVYIPQNDNIPRHPDCPQISLSNC